jgi:hypothetical protein
MMVMVFGYVKKGFLLAILLGGHKIMHKQMLCALTKEERLFSIRYVKDERIKHLHKQGASNVN